MQSQFLQSGATYSPCDSDSVQLHKDLPNGFYVAIQTMTGAKLQRKVIDFKKPAKVYGNATDRANRVVSTFKGCNTNMGAAFVGDKGGGKTMLMSLICQLANKCSFPVIYVDSADSVQATLALLPSIRNKCVIVIDEFEKIVNKEMQQELLLHLDGLDNSNKLFLMSANSQYEINSFFKSRPGRVRYWFNYSRLDDSIVDEYIKDNLKSKKLAKELTMKLKGLENLSFDILRAVVEEVNMYGDSLPLKEVLECLNVNNETTRQEYVVDIYIEGEKVLTQNVNCNDSFNCSEYLYFPKSNRKYGGWLRLDTSTLDHDKESGFMAPKFFGDAECEKIKKGKGGIKIVAQFTKKELPIRSCFAF